jgi:hypothetical protein
MSKGHVNDLGNLHGLLTRYYNHRLDTVLKDSEKEHTGEEDEVFVMPLSPAELTAMNNFLKQNEITADAAESDELSEVQRKLKQMREEGKNKLRAVGG